MHERLENSILLWDVPVIQKRPDQTNNWQKHSSWGNIGMFLLFWVVFSTIVPSQVHALPNDLHLHFLFNGRDLNDPTRDLQLANTRQAEFRSLAMEYGFALTEPLLSPAETLGVSGFDLGVAISLADIPENTPHWRKAVEDERPDNYLMVTRIRLRKGLPFSFEVEGSIGFINNSTSVLAGFALKWALNEGLLYFPDIGFRLSVNRLFSSRDIDVVTASMDFWVSKQFSVLGMFTVTPYAGYSLVFVRASSQVLDPTPLSFGDNEDGSTGSSNFVFKPIPNASSIGGSFGSRASFGARIVWFFTSLTMEGSVIVPHSPESGVASVAGPATVGAFNMKLSFFF